MTSGQVASIVFRRLRRGVLAHGGGDAVGRVDEPRPVGDLVDFLDEDGALVAQLVHDVAVVDDLLAHVDGAVADLKGPVHHVDRAHDARAEAAQPGHEELLDADGGRSSAPSPAEEAVEREGPPSDHVTVSTSFSSLRVAAVSPAGAAARASSG